MIIRTVQPEQATGSAALPCRLRRYFRALPAPWCQVCWKPLLYKGLYRLYISFPCCVPSTSARGSISRLSYESTASWAGPTCGYQGPGEGRGCGASPTRLQGAHWQFRYHETRWGSFCTAFIRVEARIMPFQLILKLGVFSYF